MRSRGRVVGSTPNGTGRSLVSREFAALHMEALSGLSDGGVAQSREVAYRCMAGHDLTIRFAVEAAVPRLWECQVHRVPAPLVDPAVVEAGGGAVGDPEVPRVREQKSHWERLLERRTIPELEVLLEERLALLRARRGEAPTGQDEVA